MSAVWLHLFACGVFLVAAVAVPLLRPSFLPLGAGAFMTLVAAYASLNFWIALGDHMVCQAALRFAGGGAW